MFHTNVLKSNVLCQVVIPYIDSHTALVITIILIMLQYINIPEYYIFQNFISRFRISMCTDIDRMRNIRP